MSLRSLPLLATAGLLATSPFAPAQEASALFRNGSGVNPPVYTCDPPVPGVLWTAEVDRTALEGAFASVISIYPAPHPTGQASPYGEILFDLLNPALQAFTQADAGDLDVYQFPFPNDMSLVGVTGYSQALLIAPGNNYLFANAVDLTPGSAPAAARPQAAFTSAPPFGLAPLAVQFTDQSTGSISSFTWNFGDGTTSSLPSPSHTYTAAGLYDVSLVVEGPGGFDAVFEKELVISGLTAGSFYRNGGHVNPPCYFATAPVIGGTWSAVIDSRDRPTATLAIIILRTQMQQPPVDTVLGQLLVTGTTLLDLFLAPDASGFTNFSFPIPFDPSLMGIGTSQGLIAGPDPTFCNAVDLQLGFPSGLPGLIADFTGGPQVGTAPHTVFAQDLSLGNVTSWLWDWGDGTTSTTQNPSHTYNQAGTYSISLIATGPGGFDLERKIDVVTVQ